MSSKANQGDSKNPQQERRRGQGAFRTGGPSQKTGNKMPPNTASRSGAGSSKPRPDPNSTRLDSQNRTVVERDFNSIREFEKICSGLDEICKKYIADCKRAKGGLFLSPVSRMRRAKDDSELADERSRLERKAADLYQQAILLYTGDYDFLAKVWVQRLRYEKHGIFVAAHDNVPEDLSALPAESNSAEHKRRLQLYDYYKQRTITDVTTYMADIRSFKDTMLIGAKQYEEFRAALERGLPSYEQLTKLIVLGQQLDQNTQLLPSLYTIDHAIRPIRDFCHEKRIPINDIELKYLHARVGRSTVGASSAQRGPLPGTAL